MAKSGYRELKEELEAIAKRIVTAIAQQLRAKADEDGEYDFYERGNCPLITSSELLVRLAGFDGDDRLYFLYQLDPDDAALASIDAVDLAADDLLGILRELDNGRPRKRGTRGQSKARNRRSRRSETST
jgi:hypothetical protein